MWKDDEFESVVTTSGMVIGTVTDKDVEETLEKWRAGDTSDITSDDVELQIQHQRRSLQRVGVIVKEDRCARCHRKPQDGHQFEKCRRTKLTNMEYLVARLREMDQYQRILEAYEAQNDLALMKSEVRKIREENERLKNEIEGMEEQKREDEEEIVRLKEELEDYDHHFHHVMMASDDYINKRTKRNFQKLDTATYRGKQFIMDNGLEWEDMEIMTDEDEDENLDDFQDESSSQDEIDTQDESENEKEEKRRDEKTGKEGDAVSVAVETEESSSSTERAEDEIEEEIVEIEESPMLVKEGKKREDKEKRIGERKVSELTKIFEEGGGPSERLDGAAGGSLATEDTRTIEIGDDDEERPETPGKGLEPVEPGMGKIERVLEDLVEHTARVAGYETKGDECEIIDKVHKTKETKEMKETKETKETETHRKVVLKEKEKERNKEKEKTEKMKKTVPKAPVARSPTPELDGMVPPRHIPLEVIVEDVSALAASTTSSSEESEEEVSAGWVPPAPEKDGGAVGKDLEKLTLGTKGRKKRSSSESSDDEKEKKEMKRRRKERRERMEREEREEEEERRKRREKRDKEEREEEERRRERKEKREREEREEEERRKERKRGEKREREPDEPSVRRRIDESHAAAPRKDDRRGRRRRSSTPEGDSGSEAGRRRGRESATPKPDKRKSEREIDGGEGEIVEETVEKRKRDEKLRTVIRSGLSSRGVEGDGRDSPEIEELITPKRAGRLRDPGDDDKLVQVYPGLDDPESEVRLKHLKGGHIVGGHGDRKDMKELEKYTQSIDFKTKEKNEKEFITFLRNLNEYMSKLETWCNRETTIYTLVAVFVGKTPHWRSTNDDLLCKQEHFTSFRHYMEEFKQKQWPNLKQQTMAEARECIQTPHDPSIEAYAERFKDLYKLAGLAVNDHIDQFISGLSNETVKEACRKQNWPEEERTIDEVRKYASSIQSTAEVGRKLDAEKLARTRQFQKTGQVGAVGSSKKPGRLSPEKKYQNYQKEASRQRPQQYQQTQRPRQQYQQQSYQQRTYQKPQQKPYQRPYQKPYQRQTTSSNQQQQQTSRTSTTAASSADKIKELKAKMENFRLVGCYGCCSNAHTWAPNFKNCGPGCPFCLTQFKPGRPRHYAIDCNKLPSTRSKIIEAVRLATQNNTRR